MACTPNKSDLDPCRKDVYIQTKSIKSFDMVIGLKECKQ